MLCSNKCKKKSGWKTGSSNMTERKKNPITPCNFQNKMVFNSFLVCVWIPRTVVLNDGCKRVFFVWASVFGSTVSVSSGAGRPFEDQQSVIETRWESSRSDTSGLHDKCALWQMDPRNKPIYARLPPSCTSCVLSKGRCKQSKRVRWRGKEGREEQCTTTFWC